MDYKLLKGRNIKEFDTKSISAKKVFVLGIGGGCDIVGAYGVAILLQKENNIEKICYGLCISPKDNYNCFCNLSNNLYQRKKITSLTDLGNKSTIF
jgi:hypothetical protein